MQMYSANANDDANNDANDSDDSDDEGEGEEKPFEESSFITERKMTCAEIAWEMVSKLRPGDTLQLIQAVSPQEEHETVIKKINAKVLLIHPKKYSKSQLLIRLPIIVLLKTRNIPEHFSNHQSFLACNGNTRSNNVSFYDLLICWFL
jgi:hypothetical protein